VLSAPHENPNFQAVWVAIRACGIGEPSAANLADLKNPLTDEWMSVEFVQAHKAVLIPGERPGMLIRRLQSFETPRAVEPAGEVAANSYSNSAFSELLDYDEEDRAALAEQRAEKERSLAARRAEIKEQLKSPDLSIAESNRLSREMEKLW
jgi:hypothetical protein